MKLKVSYDLDNTLLDWTNHYNNRFGIPKTDEEVTKNVRNVLKTDKQFWINQPVLRIPAKVHSYCTARIIPKTWIKEQLIINGFPKAPIYQVPGYGLSKYSRIRMSGADVHIDDSISVFLDLNKRGIPCLLIDSPENQDWGPIGRIYTVDIEEIEETYNLFVNTVFKYFKELCEK